ncbi:hypothetical protein ACQKIE_09510 [Luteibacter sp. NPDC031894]|jgi:hypothetical protein|uniref:hypothetical protein n=1 Tax=Luteibacter sp. NPDC031894 TaxID=3390572 RepID=UPI003D065242
MKRITLVLTMLMTVSSLSGCIVAPHRWHDGDRDRYDHRDNDRCDSRYHDCGRNWRH